LFLNALSCRIWMEPVHTCTVARYSAPSLTLVSLSSSYAPWRTWMCRTTKLW
jgi:hypothetical protein